MIRDQFNHGFDPARWESAKQQARAILYDLASKKHTVAYSELVAKMSDV